MAELNFFDVLSNLASLFLLIAVGWAAVKGKILPAESSQVLTRLLMKITLPCTVFSSLVREYDPAFLTDILICIVLGFVLFPMNALLARPLARLCRVDPAHRGVWEFAATYCNNGFMGFPIALALFGPEGLALACVFGIPFNMLVYTWGAKVICGDVKDSKADLSWKAMILTSVNAATALGLIFYFGRLTPPAMVLSPIVHLANITTPLSMFITGMNLAKSSIAETFRSRDAITTSAARLIVLPLANFAVLMLANGIFRFRNPLIVGVLFVIMAMPCAAATTTLAEMYGADREFAARAVFISSLFCIITLPVMSLLL